VTVTAFSINVIAVLLNLLHCSCDCCVVQD